ncbi:MAG: YfbK domain-containing protein [Verrucomicrobiales bacterium]
MIDQDDPNLTTYALNEDVGDKMSLKEKELSENSEFNEFVRQVTDETVLIRKSFNLEPDIGLTDEQKNNIYEKTGLLAVTQREDDLPTKLLSFDSKETSQNVKNGKRHIKKTIITSLGSAAAAIILVMVLLHQKDLRPHEMSKRSLENDGLFSITMVENDKKVNKNKSQWFSRQIRSNPVEFSRTLRYQEVNPGLLLTENTITFDGYEFKNPAILTNRLSVFPANIGSKSYDELRLGILAGSLPSSDKINVGELINAFDYNYSEPSDDDLFAVDSEIIISPWSKANYLLRVGLSVADQSNPRSKEKLLLTNVKMSVEFNPKKVSGYRLIGESNSSASDNPGSLNQDVLLSGQTITVLYELIPASDNIKTINEENVKDSEIGSVSIEYVNPYNGTNELISSSVFNNAIKSIERSSVDTQFAASVLGYGKMLDKPNSITEAAYDLVLELANKSLDGDKKGKRAEFIEWVNSTKAIIEKEKN